MMLMIKPVYSQSPGEGQTLADVNAQLVDSAVLALKALSPHLEHVILQTGGKVSTRVALPSSYL